MRNAILLAAPVLARQALAGAIYKPAEWRKPLQFTSNGTFHISMLEDLHFGHSKCH